MDNDVLARAFTRQITANVVSLILSGFVGLMIGKAFKRFWPIPEVDG